MRTQNYSEAVIRFNKFLSKNPDNELCLLRKAQALNSIDRRTEAIETYDRILKVNPRNSIAILEKADIYSREGDYVKELETLNDFQKIHPKHKRLWYKKGLALIKLDRLMEAKYCFSRLLLLDPRNQEALIKIKEINSLVVSKPVNSLISLPYNSESQDDGYS